MHRYQMTIAHRVHWLIWAAFVFLSRMAEAQVTNPAGKSSTPAQRREVAQSAIQLLRDGNVEQALKTLETVADGGTPISLAEEDPLASACAGLHRALSQLGSEARFELLFKWSLPAGAPARVRVITALVPTIVPPTEFARALGERPRNTSFPVASIGEIRGVYCSAWSLVAAAKESGKLKRLVTDLGPLVEKKIANADLLLILAQIADGRGDMTKLADQLSRRVKLLNGAAPQTEAGSNSVDPVTLVLAAAALQHPTLRPFGEEIFQVQLARISGQTATRVRPFLRQAHATSILLNQEIRDESEIASKLTTRLKYWVPVSANLSGATSPLTMNATWLVHDDHVLHLSGSGNDALLFRYPLLGDFQFQCETQSGGQAEANGGLVYGGLLFHSFGRKYEFQAMDAQGATILNRFCPFIRELSLPTFNRLSIISTQESASVAVNLHPMWTDKSGFQTSPWVGLKSLDESSPLFRNLKLTGQPVIPRSLPLLDKSELRGWQAQVFGEQTAPIVESEVRWRVTSAVLEIPKLDSKASSSKLEQLLSYQRPLLAGESVSYEFFYEPGSREVSPALGRVAFLLQPEGIRIHWVTDGNQDWTGLANDNAVTEPLNRRGPRPLPLKANDWNRVSLARTESAVTLSLNDVLVYQRPIDWSGDHRPGLYRHREASGVQVRNVVLTGDWPETLPQDFLDNPTSTIGDPPTVAQRRSYNRLFQEKFLSDNVFAFRRRAFTMPVAARFDFLSRWVLPGPDHAGFRVSGDFIQTQPCPLTIEPDVSTDSDDRARSTTHAELGGRIVSPVFDWLDAAKELGLLAECRKQVEAAVIPDDEYQQRARMSLLILLDLEQGDDATAAANCAAMLGLFKSQTATGIADQWPETLVIDRGARKFANNDGISEFISYIHGQRTQLWKPADNHLWHGQVMSLFGRVQYSKNGGTEAAFDAPVDFKDWIPATAAKLNTRGDGYHNLIWNRNANQIRKLACHDHDFLFYRLPLRGNFEVECDIMDHTQFQVAGSYIGARWDRKNLDVGRFRDGEAIMPIEPAFSPFETWGHYRAVFLDGTCTIFINGRRVRSEKLPENFDPWIGIHSWGRSLSGMRDFRITGQPKVLDAVPMSDTRDLTGWIAYHDEPVMRNDGGWTYVGDPKISGWIVGRANPGLAGAYAESLLRYQRPLVEDGSIEYEFFHERGKHEVHPTLDRLAFILHQTGVREHWIIDGRHDRTEMAPDNATDAPQCRRGPAQLPLRSGQWNRLKLILQGTTVRLELNREPVYERELESTNQRTFGLFHYADNTEVRVCNAVMKGDWPKAVPTIAGQELAGEYADAIDADLPRLKAVFSHNFQTDGLPTKYFKPPGPLSNETTVEQHPEGIEITQRSSGASVGNATLLRFTLAGDFDFEARFTGLELECEKGALSLLGIKLDEERQREYRAARVRTSDPRQEFHASWSTLQPDGSRTYHGDGKVCEATSGRLRVARRGDKMYFLFAENDSNIFRVLGTESVSTVDSLRDGIILNSHCMGTGRSRVVWKNLILRAEKMKWYPETLEPPPVELCVMQSDGKGLRTIAKPASLNFTHVGSPEWSADGRKITMDMSLGSATTSHVITVNADGSGPKDLGSGCMPSFSEDSGRIVFSQPGKGIVTMKSDGTDRQVIDSAGLGAQWSPDGKWIAYAKAGNITLVDVKSRKNNQLLTGDAATRYGEVYWNMGWSHDSRLIAFKGRRRTGNLEELAVAGINSADGFKVLHSNASALGSDCAFLPDNQYVVVVVNGDNTQTHRLHRISLKQPSPPQLLDSLPSTFAIADDAWSHDGKSIVVTGNPIVQFVEWTTGPDSNPKPQ